jgi:glycerophosphoryl diester phosphodiesterase
MPYTSLDIQGHRGCRGLMPENSIPGFIKAIELGVTTLEMDVVISKDHKVVVSHEPFMLHSICLKPDGNSIDEHEEKDLNLYRMDYPEIKKYDCGSKGNKKFPCQRKIQAYKPLLGEVIETAESFVSEKKLKPVYYNIETKCTPESDNNFHPSPERFVDLLVEVIREKHVEERSMIQSFDIRTLQYLRKAYSRIKTVLLVDNSAVPSENLDALGFIPYAYSPNYLLVNRNLIDFASEKGMKIIPWTINEPADMKRLIQLGVDGIITDYPDKLTNLKGTLSRKKDE